MSTPPPPRPREDSTYRTTTLHLAAGDVLQIEHYRELTAKAARELERHARTLRDLATPYHTRLIQIGPAENVNESPVRPFALEPWQEKFVRDFYDAGTADHRVTLRVGRRGRQSFFFEVLAHHYERRRGWRGVVDLLLRRKPVRVIDAATPTSWGP